MTMTMTCALLASKLGGVVGPRRRSNALFYTKTCVIFIKYTARIASLFRINPRAPFCFILIGFVQRGTRNAFVARSTPPKILILTLPIVEVAGRGKPTNELPS